MIPQSFIDDLLQRVDVVEVVGRHVKLKKGGANWMGLCPFHNEKSPSFSVSPTKQFYHCFGCGAHGTAVGFLIEYSGLTFPEAVRDLAQSRRDDGAARRRPRRIGRAARMPANTTPARTIVSRRRLILDALETRRDFYRKRCAAPRARSTT